jgi:kynurenine formamidase
MNTKLWDTLAQWKQDYKWVDLSFVLSPETPHWHGFEAMSSKPAYTFESTDGVFRAFYYTIAGQYGTHIDFPAHFNPEGRWQEEYGPKDCAYPLVVIDKHLEVAKNPDYELSAQDLRDFEAQYGKIPAGAFAVFRSDWSKREKTPDNYDNFDAQGNPHYPGWSMEALKLLIEERDVAVIGHEASDTDSAVSGGQNNMACENYVRGKNRLNVELLTNLDQLPPVGAVAFVTYPRLKGGVGFSSRVFAISPK